VGRVGRPAWRGVVGSVVTVTVRVPAVVKNWLVDQAEAFGMSLAEFVCLLVERDRDER
jgi:hypothetical protein